MDRVSVVAQDSDRTKQWPVQIYAIGLDNKADEGSAKVGALSGVPWAV